MTKKFLSLDSKSAATVFSSFSILRDKPREPLSEVDLANYISKAAWRFFDEYRSEAAKRLEVNEIDLLFADIRIISIEIDGHKVVNPCGFTGKLLEVVMSITIADRSQADVSAEIFEGGSVLAYLLAKKLNFKNLIYVEIGEAQTVVFLSTALKTSYLSKFSWGRKNIVDSMRLVFGGVYEVNNSVYLRYINKKMGRILKKEIDQIFYKSFGNFVNGLMMSMRNYGKMNMDKLPPIYINSSFPLLDEIYRKNFLVGSRRTKFNKFNGEVEIDDFEKDEFRKLYSGLNQLAKRRIKWLMS